MSLIFRRLLSSTTTAFERKNIFVGNLAWTAKSEDLSTLFSQFGPVESARVLSDRETGRSRGFGFVEMEAAEAEAAVEKLNGTPFQGRDLRVNMAEPKTETPRREGGFQRREGGFQRGPRRDGPPRGDRY
ncbi:hypothetical protein HDU98_002644 [Podochytrium sp. JEL0797]|nr:hypothetical protein HDU98_002644 [Podochytrium sp. JEL0797]